MPRSEKTDMKSRLRCSPVIMPSMTTDNSGERLRTTTSAPDEMAGDYTGRLHTQRAKDTTTRKLPWMDGTHGCVIER